MNLYQFLHCCLFDLTASQTGDKTVLAFTFNPASVQVCSHSQVSQYYLNDTRARVSAISCNLSSGSAKSAVQDLLGVNSIDINLGPKMGPKIGPRCKIENTVLKLARKRARKQARKRARDFLCQLNRPPELRGGGWHGVERGERRGTI